MSTVKYTGRFSVDESVDVLFPLFSPEGELLWVDGWEYEHVMGSTELHEDYVFLTPSYRNPPSKTIWIFKSYDPKEYFLELYEIEPGDRLSTIALRCTSLGKSQTEVEISYEFVALGEKGQEFMRDLTAEKFSETFAEEWERPLKRYLAGSS